MWHLVFAQASSLCCLRSRIKLHVYSVAMWCPYKLYVRNFAYVCVCRRRCFREFPHLPNGWQRDNSRSGDVVRSAIGQSYDWTHGAVPTAERTSHSCAEDHIHVWPRVEDAPPGWYTNRREVPIPDTWLALEGSEGLSRRLAVAISFAACPFAERETMLLKDLKLTY